MDDWGVPGAWGLETPRPQVADTEARAASGDKGEEPPKVVPAPTRPLPVARQLVDDLYTTADGLVLHDHRGDFYQYDGRCWPEIDRRLVRADAYTWLEYAVYWKETKDGTVLEPWDPTRHKIDNVIDALRAAIMLDGGVTCPEERYHILC